MAAYFPQLMSFYENQNICFKMIRNNTDGTKDLILAYAPVEVGDTRIP